LYNSHRRASGLFDFVRRPAQRIALSRITRRAARAARKSTARGAQPLAGSGRKFFVFPKTALRARARRAHVGTRLASQRSPRAFGIDWDFSSH
jgi:hypothetical protein